jgi:hypothetical protein
MWRLVRKRVVNGATVTEVNIRELPGYVEICASIDEDLSEFDVPLPAVYSASSPEEEDVCVICFEPVIKDEVIQRLRNCNHHFHYSCARRWINKKPCCPTCRSAVEKNSSGFQIPCVYDSARISVGCAIC